MSKLTIVTAYFNIKRNQITNFSRTDDDYFNYFDSWARINNNLIVFCEKANEDKVLSIRRKYNQEENTRIIIIDDIRNLDFELFESIDITMKTKEFKNFMINEKNPEVVNSSYNYLMCIKSLFVSMAIERFNILGTVVWLDFGFNHSLRFYPNPEEFNFVWEYEFEKEYIHLFKIREIPNLPIFEINRRMNSYIQGGTIIADSKLWSDFWRIMRENMIILNQVGLADDDQILLLMASKRYPELFFVHQAYWNQPMKLFGGSMLTYISDDKEVNFLRRIFRKIIHTHKKIIKVFVYVNRTFKILFFGELDV